MPENEICAICQDQRFISLLSEALTGARDDSFVRDLTQKANAHKISNEQYFGELITKFGESKVAQAVLLIMQEKKQQPPHASPISSASSPSPTASVYHREPASAPASAPASIPHPAEKILTPTPASSKVQQPQQTIAAQDKEKLKSDKSTSETGGVCGACVGRPLLGMLLTLEEWFVGKDRDKIEGLVQSLEHGTKGAEEVVAELYIAFGQGAVDGINRIIRDLNVVLEEGKEKALEQKPELASINWA